MSPKKSSAAKKSAGFSAEEKAAMKERARELKAEAQKADGEATLLAKVAEMKGSDRAMAEKLHAIVKKNGPALMPKTWYGMPAYAKEGKVALLLPERRQVRLALRVVRLHGRGEPRRRRDVADLLRSEGADPRRREAHRRAREEGGELRAGRSAFQTLSVYR